MPKTFIIQGRFDYEEDAETEAEALKKFWEFVNGNWSLGVSIDSDVQVYQIADNGDQE